MIEGFCHVLGNTCRIARTAMSYSWNVSGAGASEIQRCFTQQGEELHNALTPLALFIRGLDAGAVLDYSDVQLNLNPPNSSNLPSMIQMCALLDAGHCEAVLSLQATLDVAAELEDQAAINVLSNRLVVHRRHIWQLGLLYNRPAS